MNILLDDQALQTASTNLKNIAKSMEGLKNEMSAELENLKNGFKSTAGEKYFKACDDNLLKTMADQIKVLEHISDNLEQAKNSYSTVFKSYEDLNRTI